MFRYYMTQWKKPSVEMDRGLLGFSAKYERIALLWPLWQLPGLKMSGENVEARLPFCLPKALTLA